jgi:hypothetical protein
LERVVVYEKTRIGNLEFWENGGANGLLNWLLFSTVMYLLLLENWFHFCEVLRLGPRFLCRVCEFNYLVWCQRACQQHFFALSLEDQVHLRGDNCSWIPIRFLPSPWVRPTNCPTMIYKPYTVG